MSELQALSDVYLPVCFRVGNIRMGVSVQQDLGLGRSVLVEQCTCPTGYGGTSCEVRSKVVKTWLLFVKIILCTVSICRPKRDKAAYLDLGPIGQT